MLRHLLSILIGLCLFLLPSTSLQAQFLSSDSVPTYVLQWGSNGSGDGQFNFPYGLGADPFGNIYVADTFNNRIQKFDRNGNFLASYGTSGSAQGQFNHPSAVAADELGNVCVVDEGNNRIQKFDSFGNFLTTWGSSGSGDSQFSTPRGVAADALGNVYVADTFNDRIQVFDSVGNFLGKFGSNGSGNGQFKKPHGLAFDALGNIYVADTENDRIQKFDSAGNFLTKWGSYGSGDGQFVAPRGLATDDSGNIYVADVSNQRIQKFDSNGTFLASWGSSGSGDGQFSNPVDVTLDVFASLYVADVSNQRIQKFAPERQFLVEGTDARIIVRKNSSTEPTPAPLLSGTQFAAVDDATGGYFSVIDGKDVPYFPLFWFSGVGVNGNGGGFVSELPVANDVYSGNEKAAVVLEGRRSNGTNLVNTNILAVRNKWTPALWLTASGNLYTTGSITPGSSRELKKEIESLQLEVAVDVLARLDPVTFRYKEDRENDLKVGFIAEEVPELVATPDRRGVSAMDIVGVLTRVVQDQQGVLKAQQNKISQLEEELTRMNTLEAELAAIRQRLDKR